MKFLPLMFVWKNIILIGMPGSGKSYLGRHLSEISGFRCYDSDQLNPLLEVKKVNKQDWNRFRQKEFEIIKNLVEKDEKKIISTGGGCIENAGLYNYLLNAPNETLIVHIIGSRKRYTDDWEKLLKKREKWYYLLGKENFFNDEEGIKKFESWCFKNKILN